MNLYSWTTNKMHHRSASQATMALRYLCDLIVCRYTQWDTLTLTYSLCCSNERCREKTSLINDGISSVELRMISSVELHTGIFLPALRRDYSSDLLLSRANRFIICSNKCDIQAMSYLPVKIHRISRRHHISVNHHQRMDLMST